MNRIVKFAVIGIANTGVDFIVYSSLVLLTSCNLLLAHLVSYSLGILSSYIGNSNYTFREQASAIHDARVRFATYYGTSLVGLFFAASLLSLLATWLDPVIAKALSIPPAVLFNFIAARRVLTSSSNYSTTQPRPAIG